MPTSSPPFRPACHHLRRQRLEIGRTMSPRACLEPRRTVATGQPQSAERLCTGAALPNLGQLNFMPCGHHPRSLRLEGRGGPLDGATRRGSTLVGGVRTAILGALNGRGSRALIGRIAAAKGVKAMVHIEPRSGADASPPAPPMSRSQGAGRAARARRSRRHGFAPLDRVRQGRQFPQPVRRDGSNCSRRCRCSARR